jgi:hypothetical protein
MNSVRLFKDYFTILTGLFYWCILFFYFFIVLCLNYVHLLFILIIKLIDEQGKTTDCTSVSKHALKRRPVEQNAST